MLNLSPLCKTQNNQSLVDSQQSMSQPNKEVPQTPKVKVQPLHPILDSKENINKARIQQLATQQKMQYVSPSDKNENLSPISKKLQNHRLRLLHHDNHTSNRISNLRLQAAINGLDSTDEDIEMEK